MRRRRLLGGGLAAAWAPLAAWAESKTIVLAATTSADQTGLLGYLLPRFQRDSDIGVRVVAVGTGQALDMARRGDADAVLGHDPEAEDAFVAAGFGLRRVEVMVNDFLLVGPRHDPAGVRGGDVAAALRRIAALGAMFVSRGDRSGTHLAERRFWALAGVSPAPGRGYRPCGCGMAQALQLAAALGGYTLVDRASWVAARQRGELAVLVEGDERLLNRYSVIAVDPRRHPHVRAAEAQRFVDWLAGPAGQAAIAAFRLDGQVVFRPAALR